MRIWTSHAPLSLLGSGVALPGEPITTAALLARIDRRFQTHFARAGAGVARRLNIKERHICRAFRERGEAPSPGCRNPELAAKAVRAALDDAGLKISDLFYLIGHTATPANPLPPNIALVAELLGYDGPYAELRQACTGFANALVLAHGLLLGQDAGAVAIVGSETGSVFFDPVHAGTERGQLVNLVQMGDGAGAVILGSAGTGTEISNAFYGQIGVARAPGLQMSRGGSDAPLVPGQVLEFEHDAREISRSALALFDAGLSAVRASGADIHAVDWIIPHQANGRMAEILAPRLEVPEDKIFVNADRRGNTGSAAIWIALHELRSRLRKGQSAIILGAEATKYMFGGFRYTHA